MIENLPNWINLTFILAVIFCIGLFHYSNGKSKKLTLLIILWSLLQSILAFKGFYQNTSLIPPRFLLVLIPASIFIIYGLTNKPRNWILKNRRTELSTFLHTARIPIEIVLFYLFSHKMIPELMTFEGRNFDVLAGITAPIIGVIWMKKFIGRKTLIIWNILALCLVLFILLNGILSSELPIQMFGFEQPNKAINYFPFILLPATVVPIVIYTHITDIIKLLNKEKTAYNNGYN
ncbi:MULTISPECIES: hypothetical protein [unclassified Allomuricauda]|jgi:hypothetical protein|uniref:hypothetical protein n=1 Tax=Flagellimonas sp. TaxID=2058762 RepID=UPI000E2233FF|nr:hypothetical protein [Allomuricauda sp.]